MGRCKAGQKIELKFEKPGYSRLFSVFWQFFDAKKAVFCVFGFFLRCLRKKKSLFISLLQLSSVTKLLCSGQSDHAFFRLAEIWTLACTVLGLERYGDNFFAFLSFKILGLSVQNLFWQCRHGKCSTFWPWPPLVFLAFFALFCGVFDKTIEIWRNSEEILKFLKIFKNEKWSFLGLGLGSGFCKNPVWTL